MSDFTFADLEERIPTREEEAANRPPPAVAPQMIENGRVLTLTSPQRLATHLDPYRLGALDEPLWP
jgi:hypothetical protein